MNEAWLDKLVETPAGRGAPGAGGARAGRAADGAPGAEPAQGSAEAILLRDVVRRYGEREALSRVSLSLQRGQTLAVLGANGAGKSTLLRLLATLLRPHEGEVLVLGRRLPEEAWAVRGEIGLLSHEPLLYRELTPTENLTFHSRLHGLSAERAREALEEVRISQRAEEPVKHLSRGMVQRVAIARAVLHDPQLLLLDEPRANLDPAACEVVEPLIGAQSGRTRVLVSHDPAAGVAEADVVLGLKDGRVALLADASEVSPERAMELYR